MLDPPGNVKIPLKDFEIKISNFKIQSTYLETGATQTKT